jgi:hypothetical protein
MKYNALVSASASHMTENERHFTTDIGEVLVGYNFKKDILS